MHENNANNLAKKKNLFMLHFCLNKINKKTKEIGSVKKSMNRTPKLLAERTMLKIQVLSHSVLQGTQEVLKSINKIGFL